MSVGQEFDLAQYVKDLVQRRRIVDPVWGGGGDLPLQDLIALRDAAQDPFNKEILASVIRDAQAMGIQSGRFTPASQLYPLLDRLERVRPEGSYVIQAGNQITPVPPVVIEAGPGPGPSGPSPVASESGGGRGVAIAVTGTVAALGIGALAWWLLRRGR